MAACMHDWLCGTEIPILAVVRESAANAMDLHCKTQAWYKGENDKLTSQADALTLRKASSTRFGHGL